MQYRNDLSYSRGSIDMYEMSQKRTWATYGLSFLFQLILEVGGVTRVGMHAFAFLAARMCQ